MKPLESVLVATDFSEEAGFAAARGADIARQAGLRGALVHVLPASLPASLHVQAATRAQEALAVLADQTAREGPRFEPRLLSGKVDEALAERRAGLRPCGGGRARAAPARGLCPGQDFRAPRAPQPPAGAPAEQRQLFELQLPSGVVLTSLEREGRYIVPAGETRFAAADRIKALARPSNIEKLRETFGRAAVATSR